VRTSRLALNTRSWISYTIASTALLLGLALSAVRRARIVAGVLLVLGMFAGLTLGSAPGRGVSGSPLLLWLMGAVAGVAAPHAARGVHWTVRRLRRPVVPAAVPVEDIIRYTHDFRHAGLETRMLLSVHGRVKNLFLSGKVHRPFLEAIREAASRYREETAPRLRELLGLVRSAFPELDGLDRLTDLVEDLQAAARAAQGRPVKAVIEAASLTHEQKAAAAVLAVRAVGDGWWEPYEGARIGGLIAAALLGTLAWLWTRELTEPGAPGSTSGQSLAGTRDSVGSE